MIKSGKIISKDKNCSETDKSCGIVDSFERKLCVNKDENCPIKKDDINKDFEETALKQLALKINMDENKMNFLNAESAKNKIISISKKYN